MYRYSRYLDGRTTTVALTFLHKGDISPQRKLKLEVTLLDAEGQIIGRTEEKCGDNRKEALSPIQVTSFSMMASPFTTTIIPVATTSSDFVSRLSVVFRPV